MKVTFLYHSAFLVETEDYNLLFDWTGERPLPPFDRSKPLYVFASHHHADHYTPRIFSLGMERVTYILATCIRLSAKRKAGLGIDDSCIVRMSAGQTRQIGELAVSTVRSNDAGVAFIVRSKEHSFFHAGDLNDWHWIGEDPTWQEKVDSIWNISLEKLRDTRADVAFLPLDGRLEEFFWLGLHGYLQTMDCKRVFPMHCWGDFSVVQRLKELPQSKDYRDRVADIYEDGQIFIL